MLVCFSFHTITPTGTSVFCTRGSRSLTLVSACWFCFELRKRERQTDRERSTHMLVLGLLSADLKEELILRNEKIQLVWFLARQSTSHDQNSHVSGDLWRWEASWWFTAPETGPKSGNYRVEILGNRYFLFPGVNLLSLRPDNIPQSDELPAQSLLRGHCEWLNEQCFGGWDSEDQVEDSG